MSSVPHQPELYDTLSSYNPKNPMMANKPKQVRPSLLMTSP